MCKCISITLIIIAGVTAQGASLYKNAKGETITKVQAIVALANNPRAEVYKLTRVELSDKGTLKNVKESAR